MDTEKFLNYSKIELILKCKELNITNFSSKKKSELIILIENNIKLNKIQLLNNIELNNKRNEINLLDNIEFIEKIKEDWAYIKCITKDKFNNELINMILNISGNYIKFIPKDILTEDNIMIAIENDKNCIRYLPLELINKYGISIYSHNKNKIESNIPTTNKIIDIEIKNKNKGIPKKNKKLGDYYKNIGKNYELMKKYYLISIESGSLNAMYELGNYYKNIEKNYELMKKYYLMGIEKGDLNAMYELANYYKIIEKNYELMKKYYLMNDSAVGICNLAKYYRSNKDYKNMKKYYLIAIEKGLCIDDFGFSYGGDVSNFEKNYKKYLTYIKNENCSKLIIDTEKYYHNYAFFCACIEECEYIGSHRDDPKIIDYGSEPMEINSTPWLEYGNIMTSDICVGKWMLYYNNEDMNLKWSYAKKLYSEKNLTGVISMKCSTNYKNPRASCLETVVIILYCSDSENEEYIINIGKIILNMFNYKNQKYIYYKTDGQTSQGTIATGEKVNHKYKLQNHLW